MPSQRKVKPADSNATPETSAKSSVELIEQPHGGKLQRGNPGNAGGGRTPDEFKAWMAEMASSQHVEAGLRAIIADPASPMFLGALKHVTEHGYGKPKESKEIRVFDNREEAASALAALMEEAAGIPARAD